MGEGRGISVGIRVISLDEVDSTNEYAKKIARKVPEGTVVLAKRQTAGRGRKGRRWESPEGGLWMSVILKPQRVDSRLVFVGALAVVDTLSEFGLSPGIKWPNDVWVAGRKIAGILTEGRAGEYTVLGIGLNVNNPIPPELQGDAVSMLELIGTPLPLDRVLERLLFHLNAWYRVFKERPGLMMAKVRERTFILGRTVKIIQDYNVLIGRAVDVLDDGSLLLDIDGQLRRILYGDVSLRLF
ncbi:biotin--[acetyl-CoA-carboxylase] ligase [Thermococcus barossii]|uniref:Biotin--[acetyl-CoA-carboxylase] ligase n=1 Tax=Thermococcus barossii TaxID=54077 RepID=A0A2Z2MR72_9EURY|nr:biotin--[acetyl-CoA-carboxylase] ligase [Thermococcus barossii]ASJ04781.1 biotin--[acetyl-CoA-carboxylase] ligase [Thermococcus barossii]